MAFAFIPAVAETERIQLPHNEINQENYDIFAEEDESPEFEYPSAEDSTIIVKPSKDYAGIYNNLETADFSYMHDIDPDQYYDMKDTTWSPYPLLRLNAYIYFKDIAIPDII